jgi:hypothetical protein
MLPRHAAEKELPVAVDERLCNFPGTVVFDGRPHMQQPRAQALRCLRSWHP